MSTPDTAAVGTVRPVPRWAERTARALPLLLLPLLLLPMCLWRLPFAFGFEMGQVRERSMPPLALTLSYHRRRTQTLAR